MSDYNDLVYYYRNYDDAALQSSSQQLQPPPAQPHFLDESNVDIFKINEQHQLQQEQHEQQQQSVNAVPALKNGDEIFQLLSNKIAKYCQVLADLTNCEVFYKAYLPDKQQPQLQQPPTDKKTTTTATKSRRAGRTLFWGTYKMLFEYSHENGIRYEKNHDSLIKINQRSLSTDVNNLIEEILNEPNAFFVVDQPATTTTTSKEQLRRSDTAALIRRINSSTARSSSSFSTAATNDGNAQLVNQAELDAIKFKECRIMIEKLDEPLVQDYLRKFEQKFDASKCTKDKESKLLTKIDDRDEASSSSSLMLSSLKEKATILFENDDILKLLPSDQVLYSDADPILAEEDDYELMLQEAEHPTNNSSYLFKCEHCFNKNHLNIAFKYLTQLKVHVLRVHENLNLNSSAHDVDDDYEYECSKCNLKFIANGHLDFLKHLVTCFNPGLFKCATCSKQFDSYRQYYFHTKFIHTACLFACSKCERKFSSPADLNAHDQLIHSTNRAHVCEYCPKLWKFASQEQLYEHYKRSHLLYLAKATASSAATSKIADSSEQQIVAVETIMNESSSPSVLVVAEPTTAEQKSSERDSLEVAAAVEETTTAATNHQSNDVKMFDPMSKLDHRTQEMVLLNDNDAICESNTNENDKIDCCSNDEYDCGDNDEDEMMEHSDSSNGGSSSSCVDAADEESPPSVTLKKSIHKKDLIRGLLDRKHQCKWCHLHFYSKAQLKEHEQSHSNTVLYCPVCDKHFNNKERLSGHMKCHMEPSLECKVCGKKFKRLCNLYNHELVHGLTEHAFMLCQFCGRGFRSRRDYQNHVIANHRDQIMKNADRTDATSASTSSAECNSNSGKLQTSTSNTMT